MLKTLTHNNSINQNEQNSEFLNSLSKTNKMIFNLGIQKFLGWLAYPILSATIILAIRVFQGYRVRNLSKIRKEFQKISSNGRSIVICPNHLTMIDSVIIQYALVPMWRYFFQYRLFAWNIPAKENFSSSILLRFLTYLSKCIPIDRGGSEEHIQNVLRKVDILLKSNETFLIFPEGKRSRTGKIETEEVTYGVGKILQNNQEANVLCVYLRGDKQDNYSKIPLRGDRFYLKIKQIFPITKSLGLRGQRDLSIQIIHELKSMENEYEKR